MRFLGVLLAGDVPDARTVWAFRDALKEAGLIGLLFERFNQADGFRRADEQRINHRRHLRCRPHPAQQPRELRPHQSRCRARQVECHPGQPGAKDIDARWAKKGGQDHYGYYARRFQCPSATKLSLSAQ